MTGVVRRGTTEYRGEPADYEVFVLDEPIDVYVQAYLDYPNGPSWHRGVVSATVVWRDEKPYAGPEEKRTRVTGTVMGGGKWTGWMDEDGVYHNAAGVLAIHDATYEVVDSGSGSKKKTTSGDAEKAASKYESVLGTYRDGLASDVQPSYEEANPEAWAAREHIRENLAYALHDLNGDGSEELLIGVEEDEPTLDEGLSVWYRLYDLFTIVGGKPARVLGDEQVGSLGYRAYCVPCKDGVLATGGSGGMSLHLLEYWRMGKKAGNLKLISRVVVDGDTYTFEDSDGKTETLTGEIATNRSAGIVSTYIPIARFDWHLLYDGE